MAEITDLEWPPVKTQQVRIGDVLVIGPLLVAGGIALGGKSALLGIALGVTGLATMFYNARNYAIIAQRGS